MKITNLTLYKVPPRWLFLKIDTDEGLTGWGEPVVEGRADTVRAVVEEFRGWLIGKDPLRIEDHWQVMYRTGFYRGGPEVMSAISGIDQALREIARYTSTPIATGERMFSRWEFKNLLKDGYVDIIQPDLSHAGGISECKKIAAMAEAYDVAVAPHCPLGPIARGACIQLDTCTPNVFIQEQSLGIHYNQGGDLLDYLKDASIYQYKEGFLELMTGPGRVRCQDTGHTGRQNPRGSCQLSAGRCAGAGPSGPEKRRGNAGDNRAHPGYSQRQGNFPPGLL